MIRRSHGVNGRNYVTHLYSSDRCSDRTECGLVAKRVNCQSDPEPVTEATCRRCARLAEMRKEGT